MKMRPYGALTSAFLLTLTTGAAQASDCCPCRCPPKAVHHAAARPAPVRIRHADADEYARSFYDYHSSSSVSEVVSDYGDRSEWEVAPDDARIRFRPYRIHKARIYGYGVNDNDFRGGVGESENAEIGGGYGFMGGQTAFYGEAGQNGPTYNSYGESFSAGAGAENFGRFERPVTPHGFSPGGGMNR
jgi:hypothetical protein